MSVEQANRAPVDEWNIDDVINKCLPEVDGEIREAIIDRLDYISDQRVSDATYEMLQGEDQ